MAKTLLVHLSVFFLALGTFQWHSVSAARIKVSLSEYGVARLQSEVEGKLPEACLDYKRVPRSEIASLSYPDGFEDVPKPWDRFGVIVGRSEAATDGLNRVIGLEVSGLGGDTLEDVIDTLKEGGCLVFLFGGAIRDQFLGDVPRDADMDTNCETEQLLEICEEEWGAANCKGSSPVFHIGNPTGPGEEDLDIAYWESFFFGPKTNLEFSTNSVAYYPELEILIDLGFNGVRDTCERKIRIPVPQSFWRDWKLYMHYGVYRFWKLRIKDYTAANLETQLFIVSESEKRMNEKPAKFQEFFCRKALPGEWDKSTQKCYMPPTLCGKALAKKAKYYVVFEEDFGKFWETTAKPLLDELKICESQLAMAYFFYLRGK